MLSDDHQDLADLPKQTLKMAQFISAVVRTATISATPARQTAIPCRKDSGKNKCSGFIKVQKQDIPTSQVNWCCNKCDENGCITGWEVSHDNLAEFAEPPTSSGVLHPIILTRHEYQALLDSYILEPSCQAIILDAIPLIGGIQINIPEDDLEYFMETIAPICNHEKNRSRARLMDSVFGKCYRANAQALKRRSIVSYKLNRAPVDPSDHPNINPRVEDRFSKKIASINK